MRTIMMMLRLLISIMLSADWLSARPQNLDIYWIDVEGGAATLIVTPAGESVLIDSGDNVKSGRQPDRDAVRIHDVAIKIAELSEIDHLVITHWHSDHYGGATRLSQLMPIRHFYGHGPIVPTDPDANKVVLLPLYDRITHGRSQTLHPNDVLRLKQLPNSPTVTIKCIASDGKVGPSSPHSAPNPLCRNRQAGPTDITDNARSLALLVQYGKFTFFDGGDLTWEAEEKLVCPTNRVGTVNLFQIDHHGLDLSNNPVLIRSIRPRVVVVNNGPTKGAEPHTLKTLKSAPGIETIWQVHRNVRTEPELNTDAQFIANQEADCKAEFIKASVNPDGSFSVQIGHGGTRRSYEPL